MRIAVTLTDPKKYDLAKEKGAHLVEYKLGDFLKQGWDKDKIVEKLRPEDKHIPIILTLNRPAEGDPLVDNDSLYILEELLDVVDYVDLELDTQEEYRDKIVEIVHKARKGVIVSWHDYEKTPSREKLEEIYRQEKEAGADYCKIYPTAQSTSDTVRVLEFMKEKQNIICWAMGDLGKYSRILTTGAWSFAVLDKPSAAGQWRIGEMYKWKEFFEKDQKWKKVSDTGDLIKYLSQVP